MKQVFIVGANGQYGPYGSMFKSKGWAITPRIKDADLLQFTGGQDVAPVFYHDQKHPKTTYNLTRDREEAVVFNIGIRLGKSMAGICRGGQFLNAMCGGKMYQHSDGHATGKTHTAIDLFTGESFRVTSTHHQIMIPHQDAQLIAVAFEATFLETANNIGGVVKFDPKRMPKYWGDAEIISYPDKNVFCFQPHPEFSGVPDLKDRYFKYLRETVLREKLSPGERDAAIINEGKH